MCESADQFFYAVILLHALQLSLAMFHLLLQMPQMLQQLLMGDGQGLMAPNDGHNQRIRSVIKVI